MTRGVKSTERTRMINVRLTIALIYKLDALAKARNLTRSDLLRALIINESKNLVD